MLISTKGRYALRVMIDLAQNKESGHVAMKIVAARQGISLKYLERILPVLTKNGLIEGVHGKGGGYRLCREPKEYKVGATAFLRNLAFFLFRSFFILLLSFTLPRSAFRFLGFCSSYLPSTFRRFVLSAGCVRNLLSAPYFSFFLSKLSFRILSPSYCFFFTA